MQNAECRMQNEEGLTDFSILHSAFCVLHSYEKGSACALPSNHQNRVCNSAEQSFFLQLLTINTKRRPGNRSQSLLADRVPAVGAGAEVAFLASVEGLVDQHQKTALAVGQREVDLFRVGAGGFVREVLNAVVGQGVAGCFVALEGIEQLVLLLPKSFDLRRVRV